MNIARLYIRSHSEQLELDYNRHSEEIMFTRGIKVERSTLEEAFVYLSGVYERIGFSKLGSEILKHFAIIRVLEPASKMKSVILLNKYFNIQYKKTTVFRQLEGLVHLKEKAIDRAIQYANEHLQFDFSLIFYDVTTLYFETFTQDEFRRNGFSKDNKLNQPQILIGLVVDKTGFPIYYDIFSGNTFEGKTIIPIISGLKERYKIRKFTVVADAGMLSENNLQELEKVGIDYIVGARIGCLNITEARSIAGQLNKVDKKVIKRDAILYEYSVARARKDKADNDKAILKAQYYLKNPSKAIRRLKFLSGIDKKDLTLNEKLVEKHRLLEGIKGYKTNITDVSEQLLITRYHDLWRIEQSFRIAKSDLEARPIYHRKQLSIQYHLLIVFVALCMTRVIEQEKGKSIRQVVDELKDKWTVTLK
ncbi:MAG: IS1634 family transposase, partial [bacterium]